VLQKFPFCSVPHTNVLKNGGVPPSTSPCQRYRTPMSLPDSLELVLHIFPNPRQYVLQKFPFCSLPHTNVLKDGGVPPSTSPCQRYRTPEFTRFPGVLPSTSPCKDYRTPDSPGVVPALPRARAYHTPDTRPPRQYLIFLTLVCAQSYRIDS